jgi:hypothetical protein
VIAQLPCKKEKGRVVVDEFLEAPGFAGLWAIGDCAAVPDAKTGGPQPPTAQHALRQARHAAKNIEAVLAGHQRNPFRFSTIGQLASIGHRSGVANILGMTFSGFVAWFLWRGVYLLKAPEAGKEDGRGALLVIGDDLLEGPRADADPSRRRVDLANRNVAASRHSGVNCTRRLKGSRRTGLFFNGEPPRARVPS